MSGELRAQTLASCQLISSLIREGVTTSVSSSAYTRWYSPDPGVCAGIPKDHHYLYSIMDAWILRGDESEADRLIQEYADIQRNNKSVGHNLVYDIHGGNGDDAEFAMAKSSFTRQTGWQENGNNNGSNCYRLGAGAHRFFDIWWETRGNFRTPNSP